jgi:hypothetical protein
MQKKIISKLEVGGERDLMSCVVVLSSTAGVCVFVFSLLTVRNFFFFSLSFLVCPYRFVIFQVGGLPSSL